MSAAAICFAACQKDGNESGNGSQDGSYWSVHNGVAGKGIKSISSQNETLNYDKNGRLVSTVTPYGEQKITYNSEGYPVKVEGKGTEEGQTEVKTMEYGNKGKFCPVPMGPGRIMHIYENGLVGGLSKISWTGGYNDGSVMEYKFSGNKLTIHTEYSSGQEADMNEPVEDIVFEYDGAYPVSSYIPGLGMDVQIGPITYLQNGMFESYKESYISDGYAYLERTTYTSKAFTGIMLMEREVTDWYNHTYDNSGKVTGREFSYTETRIATYNEHGDITKEETTYSNPDNDHYITTYEYEYDSKGNWTKCTTILTTNGNETNRWEEERTIEYY